jgi:hypothetical protein
VNYGRGATIDLWDYDEDEKVKPFLKFQVLLNFKERSFLFKFSKNCGSTMEDHQNRRINAPRAASVSCAPSRDRITHMLLRRRDRSKSNKTTSKTWMPSHIFEPKKKISQNCYASHPSYHSHHFINNKPHHS